MVVHLGGQEQPVIKDYLVGPLPVSERTTLEERRGIYHREDIPYNARGFNLGPELARLLGQIMPPLAEPMQVRCYFLHASQIIVCVCIDLVSSARHC